MVFVQLKDLMRRRYRLPSPLDPFENKVSSQFGEDGIIAAIFQAIPPRSRYFVEFGIGPAWHSAYEHGLEGNCVQLRVDGWDGLMMDAGEHPAIFDVRNEFITHENINDVLKRYLVPRNLDVLSIDVDGQDLWIWKNLQYYATLVVIEYNGHIPATDSVSVPIAPDFKWDGTQYYGASLRALDKIANQKGYRLVFANGVNSFFVLEKLLANPEDFKFEQIFRPAANHGPDLLKRPLVTI